MIKIYENCLWAIGIGLLLSACTATEAEQQAPTDEVILDKSLAPLPPMGWNSFDCFGLNPQEADIRANAEYVAKHLKPLGYEYIVIDGGWYHDSLASDYTLFATNQIKKPNFSVDEYGRLIPDPDKFPSSRGGKGFKPLADYIHSLGLKFGIHIMRGIPWQAGARHLTIKGTDVDAATISDSTRVCEWFYGMPGVNVDQPGGQEYYNSVFAQYADWGVDYVKADDQNYEGELIAINKAVANSGRPMLLSIVGDLSDEVQMQYSHLWRISSDFWDDWEMLKAQFGNAIHWAPTIGKQGWPDLDMLPVGKIGKYICYKGPERFSQFTEEEHYSLFSLWYMMRSPLMLGGNLPENPAFLTELLHNEEALALNRRSENNRLVRWRNAEMVWAADVPDSEDKYVAVFNNFGCGSLPINVSWKELGLEEGEYTVRDLWKKEEVGTFAQGFAPAVRSHEGRLFKISSL